MTSKEAKSILNEYRNRNYNSSIFKEYELAKAIDIVLPKYVELESCDTPMKVIKTQNWSYHCPKCKDEIDVSNVDFDSKQVYKYCHHCGQKLDWSNL